MSLKSDLIVDESKFETSSISDEQKRLNDHLIELGKQGPQLWEVGPAKYRQMRWAGETAFPAPTVLSDGKPFRIPSREKGREIPCRLMLPSSSRGPVDGVFMHLHGGGWVLMDEGTSDPYIHHLANSANLAVLSIGYRLAPEDPFPASPEDCIDAAEWLISNAESQFGAPLQFMGGESAGGHLTLLTTLALRTLHPSFHLRGLILNYPVTDLSLLPSARNFSLPLILPTSLLKTFISSFLPTASPEDLRSSSISPFYASLGSGALKDLPAALFLCGTLDPLLDDSVLMSAKWTMSGNESVVKIFAGASHGFISFGEGVMRAADEGRAMITEFLIGKKGAGG